MVTNYEIAHTKILPQFRRAVAKAMATNYRMRQQEIAKILGTTQAAVSKYINLPSPNIKLNGKDVLTFIDSAVAGKKTKSMGVLCKVCQTNRKFECNFMIKQ